MSKVESIARAYSQVRQLAASLGRVRFRWVPREENEEADQLSRLAYRGFVLQHLDEFRRRYGKYVATDRQLALIKKLGGEPDPLMSRREASKLIDRLLREKRRRKTGRKKGGTEGKTEGGYRLFRCPLCGRLMKMPDDGGPDEWICPDCMARSAFNLLEEW